MNDVLVVDDFHYIPEAIRSSVVRAMKSAVFEGLCVVMLSVPYRAFDVLSAEAEMEGRFSHLAIPAWDQADLLKIAEQGFPAMGLVVDGSIQRTLSREALGSPLLMQSLCSQLCIQLDVTETVDPPRAVHAHEVDLQSPFCDHCSRLRATVLPEAIGRATVQDGSHPPAVRERHVGGYL